MKNSSGLTLTRINEITLRINSQQELSTLLQVIMQTAREFLYTEGSSLLLHDPETGDLVFDVATGQGKESLTQMRVPAGTGIAGLCAQSRNPVLVNDAQNDPRINKDIDRKLGYVTRNLLAVPMIVSGDLVGVLEVVNTLDGREFSSRDTKLLMYLSNMAALAILNRRLLDDLSGRLRELSCIYNISEQIRVTHDPDELMDNVLSSVRKELGADKVSLVMYSEDTHEFITVRSLGSPAETGKAVPADGGILGRVLKDKKPLLVSDYKEDLDFIPENHQEYLTRSFISVPLFRQDSVSGILSAADRLDGKAFGVSEMQVLATAAAQLSEALQKAESRRREAEAEQYMKDIKTASQIQRSSLPVVPPRIAGLEMAARYQACREVGGDFYDLVYHSEDRVTLVMADVSGKGVPAALFMEYSKTLINSQIPRNLDPVTTLTKSNAEIMNKSRAGLFVTVMLVQVEKEYRRLRFASAGHNHQLLLRRKEGIIENLSTKGPPLGIFPQAVFQEKLVYYDKGDVLILYTDGITESEGQEDLNFFGEERLYQSVLSRKDKEPSFIADGIFSDIAAFTEGREQFDDSTLMVVRL